MQLIRTGVLLSHFQEAVLRWRVLIVFTWMLLTAARVDAAPSGLLLVSDSDVPASIGRSVKRKLAQLGEIEENRGLAPGSDVAFAKMAARAGAALIVGLRVSDGELLVELRDAGSGAVVSTYSFALQGRRLKQPARALRELVASTREHLSKGGAAPTRNHVPDTSDESAFDEEVASPEPEPTPREQVATSVQPMQSSGEQIMDDPELSAHL
ncbi:MAG TPA: hypothetical protein VFN67_00980, partial [Polyangiales bacterium]|nr:hypothetical protein [Polyangiales bacterium]